ncbi:MAG: beta-galactosidase, partial [Alphaproteobacteria bacterium]
MSAPEFRPPAGARLGVCYYPEHWPESRWAEDAALMREVGISVVRIGEFAWSRLEPEPGRMDWGWLDRAFDTLARAGLGVVLGTPTATPPRWMLDRHPDMLPEDRHGRRRGFGSRRHYSFAHPGYRAECARITEALARRYGRHPALVAWQTDNEYGCHDTTLSWDPVTAAAFRDWLAARYGSIGALNAAWGNVFWSMDYAGFDQIEPPGRAVTECNPAHVMAFRRFASEQVAAFNRLQTAIIRAHSAAPITHNFMGRVTDFDHFELGRDLDFASWDSYPLGFLEDRVPADEEARLRFMRQGDPDFQAFHHDLYRAVGGGRWWVMEQQPGPVNWAPWNPDPLPGMVRLWAWEAFAHGAEVVSFFRWRQLPFAQEQMHAGLLRPDGRPAPALAELRRLAAELAEDPPPDAVTDAPVALIFDYESQWAWETQPQGRGLDHFTLAFALYRALRDLGLDIDVIGPRTRDFSRWKLVLAPGLVFMPDALKAALARSGALVLAGPRAASRDGEFTIPQPLPPDLPGLDCRVDRVETLRPGAELPLAGGGYIHFWREVLEGASEPEFTLADGAPLVMRAGRMAYLGGWPDRSAARRILRRFCALAGIAVAPED